VARGSCGAKAPPLAACPTVNVSCLLWAGSGISGVRYLRAIGYFSMSQCATGPARPWESRVLLSLAGPHLPMHLPMHTPLANFNVHPSIHAWNSGPIQWARGGVGRPDDLGWKKINQRTYSSYSYTTTGC